LSLNLAEIQLGRFFPGGRSVKVTGSARGIWNTMDSFMVWTKLDSLRISGQSPIELSANGFVDAKKISFTEIEALTDQFSAKLPYISIDREKSLFEASAIVQGSYKKRRPYDLDAGISASFAPIDSWFGIGGALRSFTGTLDIASARMSTMVLEKPCSFVFSRTRDEEDGMTIQVSGGPEDMLRFERLENGSFYVDLAYPSPVRGFISGRLGADLSIDAAARDVFIDLPIVWGFVPIDDIVHFSGGFITGETLIQGSLLDPEFHGSAWGSGVRLTVPPLLSYEVGPGSGLISLEGSEISFGPVNARSGKGSGEIEGTLRFNHWIPSFIFSIRSMDPLPFNVNQYGLKAKGDVSGDIELVLENDETLTITGNIEVLGAEIGVNAEDLRNMQNMREMTDLDIITNIRVGAGTRVEFMWPSEELPMIRAYAEPGTGVRVIADTRIPQFAIDGDLVLRGGEIYYLQRSFYIREGRLMFNASDPQINPRITARAEIKDRYDQGPVTISMVIDNAPLDSFTPRFESNPALSQLEIWSLLGQSPTGLTQDNDVLIKSVFDVVTQFTVVRNVERQVRDILGLDMFSVRTQVLQNALLQVLPQASPEPVGMGNYFDNTAVFIGKYIGTDMFIQSMVSLRYDEYREAYGGLRLEPDIGINLRTPLAELQYNIAFRHPEHMYIDDQSFSLLWHWSF
jgi:hypothetical protein